MNPFIITSSYVHSGVAFSVWAEDSDNSESALAEAVKLLWLMQWNASFKRHQTMNTWGWSNTASEQLKQPGNDVPSSSPRLGKWNGLQSNAERDTAPSNGVLDLIENRKLKFYLITHLFVENSHLIFRVLYIVVFYLCEKTQLWPWTNKSYSVPSTPDWT